MSHLSIAVLGPPVIRHRGDPISFRTRKALALLVYLAVEGGSQRREKLTTLLWPESDDPQGRATLRSTLAYLRAALDEDGSGHAHLIVDRDTLAFDGASDHDVDAHVLGAAAERARRSPRPDRDGSEYRQALLAADSAYRGEFLDGFSLGDAADFDEWVSSQREIWHRRAGLVFDRLARLYAEEGNLPSAIDVATRWVTHDPLNELAHRALMRLYFAAGDRSAALQAFESCRSILAAEVNATPSPETLDLVDRILAGNSSLRKERQRTASDPKNRPGPPLIGRASEHAALVGIFRRLRREGTEVVAIEGEAGIGKTRLASEFLSWARSQGAEVLQGRAFELGGRLPYQPLVEAIRRLPDQDERLAGLGRGWLAELGRILPELRDLQPTLPQPTPDEALGQSRLFEAIARLGGGLAKSAASGSFVLFVDDVQWADVATLDLVSYLARAWDQQQTPAMLLLSVRTETLDLNPDLADWLDGLERAAPLSRVRLGPLTGDDTRRLVLALGARSPGDALADPTVTSAVDRFGSWLFRETGGQPFFLIETLKLLVDRGLLGTRVEDDGTSVIDLDALPADLSLRSVLPESVRDRLRSRLNHVSPDAFNLLVAGAVLGQRFAFESMSRIAAISEDDSLRALDELVKHRFIHETRHEARIDPEGRYEFAHDKIREVAYTEAGEARRVVFHRRTFELLETQGSAAATLAHHAAAGRQFASAFRYALQAGDDAIRLFAMRDAVIHYRAAAASPAPDPSLLPHLYRQLGRAYELLDDPDNARSAYESLLAFARETGQPTVECTAINRLATLLAHQPSNLKEALDLLQQAVTIAAHHGDWLSQAETEWNLAHLGHYTGRLDLLRQHGQRALALAREHSHDELTARTLNVLTYGASLEANWGIVRALATEAQEIFARIGDRALENDCLMMLANADILQGHAGDALIHARRAVASAIDIDNPWLRVNALLTAAFACLELGDFAEALRLAQEATALARSLTFRPLLFLALVLTGSIHRALQAFEEAKSAHLEAREIYAEVNTRLFGNLLTSELCSDYVVTSSWDEAWIYAQEAVDEPMLASYHWGLAHWNVVEALIHAGAIDDAEQTTQSFGELAVLARRYGVTYRRCLASLAAGRGDTSRAIGHLVEAARLAEEIGLPGELWPILVVLGDLEQSNGDLGAAAKSYARAAQVVREIADRIDDQSLRTAFLQSEAVARVLESSSGRRARVSDVS